MSRNRKAMIATLGMFTLIAFVGCSQDDSTPTAPAGNNETVVFSDYAAALAAVVPPEFTGRAKAAGNYSIWIDGDYPLLGKAIGNAQSDEPMSLYRNLNTLESTVELIEQVLAQGEGQVEANDPDGNPVNANLVVEDLTAPVAIPVECQGALGFDELTLAHVCRLSADGDTMALNFGYTRTEARETILSWNQEGTEATSIFYATKDVASGEIEIRGAFYKVTTAETASWIYAIGTAGDDNTQFVYNMAWYSDGMGDAAGLGCVQGSGDRNESFGLRYHQYRAPWTRGVYDAWGPFEQLFGPSGDNPYADLNVDGEYPTDRAGLIDEDAMFVYDDMPHAFFASPFGE